MPKIRKRTSKRIGFREKYCVKKKVTAHHKKMRRTAKKLSAQGLKPKPGKNKMVIPNAFPGKEEMLNEMYMQEQIEREEKKKAIADLKAADAIMKDENNFEMEQSLSAKVVRNEEDEAEKYGGLTNEELKEAENLIDPESELRQANINKKSHWRDVKKVIEKSEVVIYVLDARDPEGTRCEEAELMIKEQGKKIVFVINKKDLVPEENVKAWQQKLKAEKHLCIVSQANHTIFATKEQEE